MSKHFENWSKLSALVMHIQGISYAYLGDKPCADISDAPHTLYELNCDFNYECFYQSCNVEMHQYINQIFDVFQNLTLYEVSTYSISDLTKQINKITNYLQFLPKNCTSSLNCNFNNFLSIADNNAKNIEKLLNTFSENNLTLSHSIFDIADEEMIKNLKQRRNLRKGRLIKSIHN